MREITFSEKNNLVVRYQDGKYFFKDLELFKKYFPAHELNTQLSNANAFTYERLDGQILNVLLDNIDIKEILCNRKQEIPEAPEPVQYLTWTEIRDILKLNVQLPEETYEDIEENYLEYLKTKTTDDIIQFAKPLEKIYLQSMAQYNALKQEQTKASEYQADKIDTESKTLEEPSPEKTEPKENPAVMEIHPHADEMKEPTVSTEPEVPEELKPEDKKKETKGKNSPK